MTDTLLTRLDEPATAIFWWCRISGIPYLFCAGEVPDSHVTGHRANGRPYVEFDGDTYDWLQCLVIGDGWGQTGTQMQPKGGMPQSGGLSFTFRIDDTIDGNITQAESQWLKLLTRAIKGRSDGVSTTNLAANLAAGGTPTLTFTSNPWDPVTGDVSLYIGLETLIVDDTTNTPTQRGPASRGRFGSKTKDHQFESVSDDESHATGLIVADFPLMWEGRVIDLYMSLGHWQLTDLSSNAHLGEFETYSRQDGSDLVWDSPNTALADRFVVTNVREGGDLASVIFETAGLDGLIDGDIMARVPRAVVGLGPGQGWWSNGQVKKIYVGSHNWQFSAVFRGAVTASAPISLEVKNWSVIADGDMLQWDYPGGSMQARAKTTPSLPQDFYIGTSAATYLDNLEYFLRNDSHASTWREHYRVERTNDGRRLLFKMVSAVGTADEAYAFSSTDPNGAGFSQANTAPIGMAMLNQRLRYYTGASMADVPEGLYNPDLLGEYMRQTAVEHFYNIGLLSDLVIANTWVRGAPHFDIRAEVSADGQSTNKLTLGFGLHSVLSEETSLDLFTRYSGKESFLRDMGFTNDSYFAQGQENVGTTRITATKSPAAFRWPRKGYQRPARLYLHDMAEWDADNLVLATSFFDSGGVLGNHAVIDGVDLVEFSEGNFSGWVSSWDASGHYVNIDESNFFQWATDDEFYVEIPADRDKEIKLPEFERVIFFKNGGPAASLILQLLIGGSGAEGALDATYDVGWLGAGLALHGDYFDIPSFTEHADSGLEKRWYCIRKGDKIRDLLDNECKLGQFQICADLGKLYLATTRPLMESDESAGYVIDASNLVTDLQNQGIGFDRAENRIVNQIDVQADYNPVTKNFGLKIPLKRADSISTYGAKEPMVLTIKGNPGEDGGVRAARRLANRIFAAYALPYAVVEVYLGTPAGWLLKCGSDTTITSTVIPEERGPARGVTALPARVFGRAKHYMGGGQGSARYFAKLTCVVRGYSGNRYSRITASAYAESYKGGGGSGVTVVCTQTLYAAAGENDVDSFSQGMIVTLYSLVDGSTVSKEVDGITDVDEIEFTTSASIALPAIILWAAYDSATATQKKYVYLSDGTAVGAADDRQFSYP